MYAVNDDLERNAPIGVALWVEKNFGMNNIFDVTTLQIGPGQIEKILFCLQDIRRQIVEIQKRLQILEVVKCFELLRRFEGQGDAISRGHLHDHFWLEAAFDVQVELGFRQLFYKLD